MIKTKIGIVVGTNRKDSRTEDIATYYSKKINEAGFAFNLINLNELPHDFAFSALYDNGGKNSDFEKFQAAIDECQKLIFVVPEYNGSYPGVLKTFVDGLRHPDSLAFKKVALVGVSSGVLGNAVGLGHFDDVLSYLNANVMGLRVKLGNINQHFSEGKFINPIYETFTEKQIKNFIEF
jgi:chromate reductase, NAD(P)H dehydrogenase (quinone)